MRGFYISYSAACLHGKSGGCGWLRAKCRCAPTTTRKNSREPPSQYLWCHLTVPPPATYNIYCAFIYSILQFWIWCRLVLIFNSQLLIVNNCLFNFILAWSFRILPEFLLEENINWFTLHIWPTFRQIRKFILIHINH